ncbi:MAG: hypothetical protein C4531_05320 [Desulfurivibrio sp.]|nr:MAG: hypothetical protein C4531_05320 [Desulfurivibrio sp.]
MIVTEAKQTAAELRILFLLKVQQLHAPSVMFFYAMFTLTLKIPGRFHEKWQGVPIRRRELGACLLKRRYKGREGMLPQAGEEREERQAD